MEFDKIDLTIVYEVLVAYLKGCRDKGLEIGDNELALLGKVMIMLGKI